MAYTSLLEKHHALVYIIRWVEMKCQAVRGSLTEVTVAAFKKPAMNKLPLESSKRKLHPFLYNLRGLVVLGGHEGHLGDNGVV
jgi:hypothetical protein